MKFYLCSRCTSRRVPWDYSERCIGIYVYIYGECWTNTPLMYCISIVGSIETHSLYTMTFQERNLVIATKGTREEGWVRK